MSDETLLGDAPEGDDENGVDHDLEVSKFERLVREVEADPGCASFPRLAEAYRRDGQADRASMIAEAGLALAPERLVGRVVLAPRNRSTGRRKINQWLNQLKAPQQLVPLATPTG